MHISVYYIEILHADDKRIIIKFFIKRRTGNGITESGSNDHVAEVNVERYLYFLDISLFLVRIAKLV